MLRDLPEFRNRNLLVGSSTADDAGVFRIDRDRALVQTVDFFTPIVDDPFFYGQIAATNAISDVYAMGGRPLTALNLLGIPADKVSPQVVQQILRGGVEKAKEANCVVLGGHTIRALEPIYGMAVTGLVSPKNMLTNAKARPGDLLVLTKPLGTGIVTTGIKRGLTSRALAKKAISLMCRLNSLGAELAEQRCLCARRSMSPVLDCSAISPHFVAPARSVRKNCPRPFRQSVVKFFRLLRKECIPGGTGKTWRLHAARELEWYAAAIANSSLPTRKPAAGCCFACRKNREPRVFKILLRHSAPCFRHHRPDHARAFSAPMHDRVESRREIPAVGRLLEQIRAEDLPHPLVVDTVRKSSRALSQIGVKAI